MENKNLALGLGAAVVVGTLTYFSTKKASKKAKRRSVQDLVRPNIASLKPYRCARDDYSEGILLDANENSIGATLEVLPDSRELNRYPCPYQEELKRLIAKHRGIRWDQIFLGVGSDEAIDMVMRIFCTPGKDAILITPPTYGMYTVSATVNDVAVQRALLTPDFDVDYDLLMASVTGATKVIFLCSPGNPTAKSIPLAMLERVLQSDYDGIVVVDEAYVDFSDTPSACCLLDKYDNLVVMQTLSKAFGLAGIRLGMAMGSVGVIRHFNAMKAPYNISKLTAELAREAFGAALPVMTANVRVLLEERRRVAAALNAMPQVRRVCVSDTNFLLFEIPCAQAIYKAMADGGVVCRFRGTEPRCRDCLRVTIGTPPENDRFLELLRATASALC